MILLLPPCQNFLSLKFCFCCSFLLQWREALKHLESTHYILFDFCIQIPQHHASLFSTQSSGDPHHLQASGDQAMRVHLWSLQAPHLLNEIQKMDTYIKIKEEPTLLIFHNFSYDFHKSPKRNKTHLQICCQIIKSLQQDKSNENSLFFFFVMVPATCLLFIFNITFTKKNKKLKLQKRVKGCSFLRNQSKLDPLTPSYKRPPPLNFFHNHVYSISLDSFNTNRCPNNYVVS